MKTLTSRAASYQRAEATIRFGRRAKLSANMEVTTGGVLSIAALVSTILLSTAVLVHVAIKDRARVADH